MATLRLRLERLRQQADSLRHADSHTYLDPVAVWQAGMRCNPDAWQREILESQHPRILMNVARQLGKSSTAACLAIHTALYAPGSLTLILSPSLRQSSELAKKVWAFYRRLNKPIAPVSETTLSLELRNESRIVCLPSKEDTVRGFSGVTLLIIDESARVLDDLYFSVRPMLASSQGRLIALSTPFGRRGWWFNAWEYGEEWLKVRVPADACPRISAAFLAEERRNLGERWYLQEYFCQFADVAGSVFALESILASLTPEAHEAFLAQGAH
jgi:hypothetical protein